MIKSIQDDLNQLVRHDMAGYLLALVDDYQLKELARQIAIKDLYRFPTAIKWLAQYLQFSPPGEEFLQGHLEHILWVYHRQALWGSGRIQDRESLNCHWTIEGQHHLEATANFPTVIISPMTVAFEDTLWLSRSIITDRQLLFYGEGIIHNDTVDRVAAVYPLKDVHFVGMTSLSVREVLQAFQNKGVYLTYPDFVYGGHKVQYAHFFEIRWPFSSSFIGLCTRPGTVLLPCCIFRESNRLKVHFEEPLQVKIPGKLSMIAVGFDTT